MQYIARFGVIIGKFLVMKRILFVIIGMLMSVAAFAQAENAKYYIEGDYEITRGDNNQFVYTLSNITSKGITFTPVQTIVGHVEDDESISFSFDKAQTDYPGGFEEGLKFWKWQYDGKDYKWQRDSEVKDAQQQFKTDGVMVVMLILDCSTSLGEVNFAKLQNAAIKFIDVMYNASPNGSVRLGIIGFNTMSNTDKMVLGIQPLTADTKSSMIQFIHGLTLYNNTSLYYAMHKGSDMIGDYVSSLSAADREKYDYACMVSFTDGYDNHSSDERIGIPDKGLDNPYFQYVRDNVVDKLIGGKELKSYVIAIKGNDVAEDNKLYQTVFKGLASDNPFLLEDFSQLETQFENMAKELMKRWQNVTCYVPAAYRGKIRWTLGNGTETPRVEPKKETPAPPPAEPKAIGRTKKNFWGVNGAVVFEYASAMKPIFYTGLGAGFDFAIPKGKNAIGGMLSLKYCFGGPTHVMAGPLFLFGDYENDATFMLGTGLDLRFQTASPNYMRVNKVLARDYRQQWLGDRCGAGATLRLGATTLVKNLYFFTDLTLGGYKAMYRSLEPTLVVDAQGVPVLDADGNPTLFYNETRPTHLYFNVSLNVGYRF